MIVGGGSGERAIVWGRKERASEAARFAVSGLSFLILVVQYSTPSIVYLWPESPRIVELTIVSFGLVWADMEVSGDTVLFFGLEWIRLKGYIVESRWESKFRNFEISREGYDAGKDMKSTEEHREIFEA